VIDSFTSIESPVAGLYRVYVDSKVLLAAIGINAGVRVISIVHADDTMDCKPYVPSDYERIELFWASCWERVGA